MLFILLGALLVVVGVVFLATPPIWLVLQPCFLW